MRKQLFTVVKIAVSAALVYFISTKIAVEAVVQTLQKSNPWYLIAGVLFFILSQVVSAFRLRLYLYHIEAKISHISNLKLYALGMFYNLFLPGGIGGDAYKGYVLQKQYKPGTKKVVSVLLLDRLSGMAALLSYAGFLASLSRHSIFQDYIGLSIVGIPLGLAVFWGIHKKFFPYALPIFWKSAGYSAGVQLLQLMCVVCLLQSLAATGATVDYLFVFLASSLVSVIPLTIGGIGSREVTFLYGAEWLGLEAGISVSISISFFLLTALTSLSGIIYHFKKPRLETVA